MALLVRADQPVPLAQQERLALLVAEPLDLRAQLEWLAQLVHLAWALPAQRVRLELQDFRALQGLRAQPEQQPFLRPKPRSVPHAGATLTDQ